MLNHIHEVLLSAIEYDNTEKEDDYGEGKAVEEIRPFEHSDASESILKRLGDGCERICHYQPYLVGIVVLHHRERINHRRGIHPQLDSEGDEEAEVSIFRCHRRYDKTESKSYASQHEDE